MRIIMIIIHQATTKVPPITTSPATHLVNKLSSLSAMDKPPPIQHIQVIMGGTAQLPCNVINPQGNNLTENMQCLWIYD